MYLQELKAHYAAVSARLNPKMVMVMESVQAEPENVPVIPVPTYTKLLRQVAERHQDKLTKYCDKVEDNVRKLIVGDKRKRPIVQARHEFMYLCSKELNWTLTLIGRRFGWDHTTVLAGIRRHCKMNGLDLPDGYRWPGQSRFGKALGTQSPQSRHAH